MEWIGAPVQDVVCGLPCTSNDDDDPRVLQEKSCVSSRFWCCKCILITTNHLPELKAETSYSDHILSTVRVWSFVNFHIFEFWVNFNKTCHNHPLVNSFEVYSNYGLEEQGRLFIYFFLENMAFFVFKFWWKSMKEERNCIYKKWGFFAFNFVKIVSEVSQLGISIFDQIYRSCLISIFL